MLLALATALPVAVPANAGPRLPSYDHVVVVVLENHSRNQVLGSPDAPFLTGLAAAGVNLTRSYAVTHPSQPNYIALFSGSTQGVTDDTCPHSFRTASLASQLLDSGRTFVGWSEGLPVAGSALCGSKLYARRHAPWTNFTNLPQAQVGRPLTQFPTDYTRLPTVSWVIPDVCHDMHNCPVATGDAWARTQLGGYARWALTHNSLLVVTFDEDDASGGTNHISTVLSGAHLVPGKSGQGLDHYGLLRTIEAFYGLKPLGDAAKSRPLTGIFR